ncbi:MAG: hypothetical protein KDC28_05910 [Saprospiraceae bacterium]|nr:hypothetical protein [Saprospiraceae bacterium]
MKKLLLVLAVISSLSLYGQDKPYYYEIPPVPETYTATTAVARMVDGLGFRYFWATEGLRDEDLQFKPSAEARTSFETIQHIYGLTFVLLNTAQGKPTGPNDANLTTFAEYRNATLENIRQASEILKQPETDLEELPMAFQRSGGTKEYPFWNLINGPISDALWHVGQVVTFRRSSGNPLPAGVNVLEGTKK